MKIADLLAKESIDLQAKVGSKAEALEHLVTLMAKSGKLADEAEYKFSDAVRKVGDKLK